MSLAVVDASVLAAFYLASDPRRARVVERLAAGDALYAPAHLDAEVASVLRGLARVNPVVDQAGAGALKHLAGLPVRRVPLGLLLGRMWELRANVTAYDAAYVALGEQLSAPVVTCDAKLAAASGARCTFEVLA